MASMQRERVAKVALLEAIARSQQAVARMLESTADVYCRQPARPEAAARQLAQLAALQQALAAQLRGVRLGELRRGRPGRPWLAAKLCAGGRAGAVAAAAAAVPTASAEDMTGRDRQ